MTEDPKIIYTLVTALVGAVTVLWRIVIKRANDCEAKHEKTSGELLQVTKEVGELKGRIHLAEKIVPKLDSIHEKISRVK
jgi:hypothetical protein